VRLETRSENPEGNGAVTQRDLVRNALRMRPDRIVVGEVRGAEVWDMLQAMNTGHEGSLTTVHANSAADALARLELMVALTGFELPVHVIRQHVALGLRLLVHVARLKGGARRVVQISELVGVENGAYVLRDIYQHRLQDVVEGAAVGDFHATGYAPACSGRWRQLGVKLPEGAFDERKL
jgi:pilus assembly protein CpaF